GPVAPSRTKTTVAATGKSSSLTNSTLPLMGEHSVFADNHSRPDPAQPPVGFTHVYVQRYRWDATDLAPNASCAIRAGWRRAHHGRGHERHARRPNHSARCGTLERHPA